MFQTPPHQQRWVMASHMVPSMPPTAEKPRIPNSAAPEKCKLEMGSEDFRTWMTSMEWWLKLNQWQRVDAVSYIRLACTPDLQRAIDSKFTVSAWSNLSVSECIEEIKTLWYCPQTWLQIRRCSTI